jgi:hypothetical protein
MAGTVSDRPVAVCTECGKYQYNMNRINEQCSERHGGERCQGVWGSALNVGDFGECQLCQGSGRLTGEHNETCMRCEGSGWIFLRRLSE